MADTSFCRLVLSGHRLRPLCRPNDPNEKPSLSKTHSPDTPYSNTGVRCLRRETLGPPKNHSFG